MDGPAPLHTLAALTELRELVTTINKRGLESGGKIARRSKEVGGVNGACIYQNTLNKCNFQRIFLKFKKKSVCSPKMECFSCIIHTILQNMNSLTKFVLL